MTPSPFHAGERAIQQRLGVHERMERFGSQVIRSYLPEQHRGFYRRLSFVLVGHADSDGWPWASMLVGAPGFMHSPDPQRLVIRAKPVAGDPLAHGLRLGVHLGLLGIELPTRRRNRLAGHVTAMDSDAIELSVDQTFGNCPQYIQTRVEFTDPDHDPARVVTIGLKSLPARARSLIENADTFFVASYVERTSGAASEGVDVSHRGGRPGFVRVDDDRTLTIPDYLGNFHFNSLGNFAVNPKAGLLFIDFKTGDLLTLTGTAEILWDDPDMADFDGAERLWRFELDHGRFLEGALPLRWTFGEYSPNTLLTGTWERAAARREANAARASFRPYRVVRAEAESDVIRSFYLEPVNGAAPGFLPGQFLTLKLTVAGKPLVRTYTVSSAPSDPGYRISVKKEPAVDGRPAGRASNHLHQAVRAGDVIEVKAPVGAFTLDAAAERPAVLLAAGVGITPMISMLRHVSAEGVRTRSMRRVYLIHAARSPAERAFFDEARDLAHRSGGRISYHSVLSRADAGLVPGVDYHLEGRVNEELLKQVLPLDASDFFLCGPPAFMQSMYDLLRSLDTPDRRIHAEAFGPASLERTPDPDAQAPARAARPEAEAAIVEFTESGFEQAWTTEQGTLLEFAEAHGLSPAYGCRNGQCGSCRVKLNAGELAYRIDPSAELAPGEALLCCSVPAAAAGDGVARVSLAL